MIWLNVSGNFDGKWHEEVHIKQCMSAHKIVHNFEMDPTRIFHVFEAFIFKAFKGAAVVDLLQALYNAANGRLGYVKYSG